MRSLECLIPFGKRNSAKAGPTVGKGQARLFIESLETRLAPASVSVVPLTQPSDSSHFYSLAEAVTAAGSSGVVTIEPGASLDASSTPVQVIQDFITIQGNPNVPAAILPSYRIDVRAGNVRLTNLSISSLTLGTSTFLSAFNQVSKCLIQNITCFAPKTTFTQNTITGRVVVAGFVAPTGELLGGDQFANNVFTTALFNFLSITSAPGTVVRENSFYVRGGRIFVQNAGVFENTPTTFANNTMFGNSSSGIVITQTGDGVSDVRIINNRFVLSNTGLDMGMAKGDDAHFRAFVQGNDFHDCAVGVLVSGDGTICGNIDLGGGALGSLGGNNFRSFAPPVDSGHAAIVLRNATNGSIFAVQNIFNNNVAASSAVFAQTGFINVGAPLSPDQSFVQALYNEVLGRTGTLDELRPWANLLASQGRAAVANGIRLSPEALGRVVDQLYLRFLGRQSDPGGRAGWISFLRSGGALEQVETLFLTSPEYLGHINTEFVQSLYLNILGRAGSSAELALWNNNIQNLGLAGIANGFVRSPEHRTNTVRSFFQIFLHRTPSNTELAPLVNSTQTLLDLAGMVLSSDEFFANG